MGLDERLAYHISQLFIRDPIPAYEMEVKDTPCEKEYDSEWEPLCPVEESKKDFKKGISVCKKWWVKIPDIGGNNQFENIQSTNWNSLRFKIPPGVDSKIGWRIEFRPMDICLTDYENAALTVMTGMIANLVNDFDLDFIMPISLVDENMERAHARNGILERKFWFKTSIFPEGIKANY